MKSWLLVLSLFLVSVCSAQTYTFNTATVIPDDSAEYCFPVNVSGMPAAINMSYGLVNVCFTINHTWDDDLEIYLRSPSGSVITLSSRNGGSGHNYTNTCVAMNGNPLITSAQAPFTGLFIPEQSLNTFNNNQNPNGIWQLCVRDIFPLADQGTILNWNITFGSNPPNDPPPPPMPCGVNNPAGCLCPDGTTNCDLLPDMTASALIIQNQHTEYPGYMTLSNATPNIGWGPMEVHAVNTCYCDTVMVPCSTTTCPGGGSPTQQVNQRIYHRNGNTMSSFDIPAGTMSYHPTHGHAHVDNWAEFTLRVATSNPNPLSWPIVGEGAKISFCLINLGDCTSDYGYCVDSAGNPITMADIPNSPFGLVSGCGNDQGIYTGNLDIYSEGLPGMELSFPGVCNGDYYIISITDPNNNFVESNENNNWVAVPMTLTDQNTPSGSASFTYSATGNQVSFTNTTPVTTGYYWDFGDGTTDTVANPVHVYSAPGNYLVKLIILNQCYSATTQQLIVTNSEETETRLFTPVLFPNPSKGETSLKYYLTKSTEIEYSLFDITGSRISDGKLSGIQGWNTSSLMLQPELAGGIYMLSLKAGANNTFVRLIISR